MKISAILRCLSLLALTTMLASLPALAGEGKVYGEGLTGKETVQLSELMDHPDEYVGKTVRVEGLIVDVCKKRGCWMELAGDREFQSIKVKVDDGVIVFPYESKGKHAVAEGVFTKIELTEEQAEARRKHMEEEHGGSDEPCANDLKAGVIYMIRGKGAVIDS